MIQIFTDTSANLPTAMCNEYNITVLPLYYYIDGEEYTCLDTESFDGDAYYKSIKEGKQVTTSQITPGHFAEAFRTVLAAGDDVIYVAMAQRISGTYDSALNAKAQLEEEFPARRIAVVNTKGASFGEGLPALIAAECAKEGGDFDAVLEAAERASRYIYQIFTVDDLKYLARTGRCSNVTAFVGGALNIKPMLKATDDGVIATFEKAHGRKKAIKNLLKYYEENVIAPEKQTVFISYAGCKDDADTLIEMINATDKAPKLLIAAPHEPVTGSHIGPGALALFFISGHNRDTGVDDKLY
jgi:DegV family protein with EDD domain